MTFNHTDFCKKIDPEALVPSHKSIARRHFLLLTYYISDPGGLIASYYIYFLKFIVFVLPSFVPFLNVLVKITKIDVPCIRMTQNEPREINP